MANNLDTPVVQKAPLGSHPLVPSGLKECCLKGPDILEPSYISPVLKYCGYTFWAHSFIDNRVSMEIVAYDDAGNIIHQWEKPGARYIWQITVDTAAKTVTFWGQANHTVVMTWDELQTPVVQREPSTSHPSLPPALKECCLKGPDTLEPSPFNPVLKYCGYTFWAYSFIDNRVSMEIVAYDDAGNTVYRWEKPGARYVWQITVDTAAKTVTFWGQENNTVVMAWDELRTPVVQRVSSESHPPIPPELKECCVMGPDSLQPNPVNPVVKYHGYTYWAYSYMDNRISMAIVAYDTAGNIIQQWELPGARYVWQVTVDTAAKTVSFWGQDNNRVAMSWA